MGNIYDIVTSSFSSLWKIKKHGETIELVTPIPTVNDNFVSIFITERSDEYIVTDGGWIEGGMYDFTIFQKYKYGKYKTYFCDIYSIKTTEAKGYTFFYKKTSDIMLLPNLVFDVSNFVASLISTNTASYEAFASEDRTLKTFRRKANNYFRETPQNDFLFRHKIDEELDICCDAVSPQMKIIVNYISGSDRYAYARSIFKCNTNFDVLSTRMHNIGYETFISFYDDGQKRLLDNSGIIPYFKILQQKSANSGKHMEIIPWKERDRILTIAI